MNPINTSHDNELRDSMVKFINRFVAPPLKERWLYLCNSNDKRWHKIDPYKLYIDSPAINGYAKNLRCRELVDIFSSYKIENMRDKKVAVAAVGHCARGLFYTRLEDALSGPYSPLDGFVLYQPASLVFCMGHHGDIWEISC